MDGQVTLTKRLASSAIIITGCVYAIFWSPQWLFVLAVEAFVLAGLYEYFTLAEKKGIYVNKVLGLIFGGMLPLTFYFPGESVVFLMTILCLFVFNFHRALKNQVLVGTAVTLFGIFYVGWFFSFFTKLIHLVHGTSWVFFVVFVTKMGDAAAYFVGQRFGRHKFIPHISPHKSIEGAVAQFVMTVLVALLSTMYLGHVALSHLFVLGIALGILSQLGDLAESLIKRDAGVKDSGAIPGLGGVLDIIDSLLFTVPFTHYYITALPGLV